MSLAGCDLSEFQATPDFDALATRMRFVLLRTSFGTARMDRQFGRNLAESRRTGRLIGGYHYCYPQFNTPEAEADYALASYRPAAGELFGFDFEEHYQDPVGWLTACVKRYEARGGPKPLVYLNRYLQSHYDWGPLIRNGNGLWLAVLDAGAFTAAPWPFVAIEQVNQGYVPGVTTGAVDLDTFFGDEAGWARYGSPAAPPPPPAPVPAPPPPPAFAIYVVQPGDTLSVIAARLRLSLRELETWNPQLERGRQWGLIFAGDRVQYIPAGPAPVPVPPPAPPPGPTWRSYVVQPGDSMSRIALKLGVRLALLEAWNPQLQRGARAWSLIFPYADRVRYLK